MNRFYRGEGRGWRNFYQLDAWRCVDLRGGLVGTGYHDFLMDEIELGPRCAAAFDEEYQAFWVLQPPPYGNFVPPLAKEHHAG